jgi:predicted amidophosphoribosyltransferase
VPLHRKSGRPFNQALEIARGVSEILKVPVKDGLEWTGGEKPQVGKASLERKQLSAGALRLSGKITDSTATSVLLVDDVCTTGTTLRRCAEALRSGTLHVTGALVWTLSG